MGVLRSAARRRVESRVLGALSSLVSIVVIAVPAPYTAGFVWGGQHRGLFIAVQWSFCSWLSVHV